jgi:hypothetical protein
MMFGIKKKIIHFLNEINSILFQMECKKYKVQLIKKKNNNILKYK